MTGDEHQIAMPTAITPEASERIQQEILARQTWPSYQEMLVSSRLPLLKLDHWLTKDSDLTASTSEPPDRSLPHRDYEDYRELAMHRSLW